MLAYGAIILIFILLIFLAPVVAVLFVSIYPQNITRTTEGSDESSTRDIAFTNYLRKMYKCAHLRSHFLNYVSSKSLSTLFDADIQDEITRAQHMPLTRAENLVNDILARSIALLYKKYLMLIEEQMDRENISHVELHYQLGTIDGLPLAEEIKKLEDFNRDLITREKSLIIIPRFVGPYDRALIYFEQLSKINSSCVKSFDFIDNISAMKSIATLMGAPTVNLSAKDAKMLVELNKDFPIIRAKNPLNDHEWKLLPTDIIYEYCPIEYATEHIVRDELRTDSSRTDTLNAARPIITINADYCNILRDKDLNDNFIFAWKHKIGYFKLQCALLYSIIGSLAQEEAKDIMLNKWHDQYRKYYSYRDKSFTFYALDKDCKWYVRSDKKNGISLINALEKLTGKFMQRAIDGISLDMPSEKCEKIVKGMELYAYKPSFTRDITWTTEEYNLPEFQYTYIRLKSLQRYTECFTMYEKVFTDKTQIKNVLSIGGGSGYELIALRDFLRKDIHAEIIDIAESWKKYADLIDCEYFIADVNEVSDIIISTMKRADLIIFSYVFKYLKDPFFAALNNQFADKMLIFNERHQDINSKIRVDKVSDEIFTRNIELPREVRDLTFLTD